MKTARNNLFSRFLKAPHGSVAALTGISLGVIIMAVGASMDLTHAMVQKSKVQTITDAASLVIVRNARTKMAQGIEQELAIQMAKTEGFQFLLGSLQGAGFADDGVFGEIVYPDITLTRDGSELHAVIQVEGDVSDPPFGLFGDSLLRFGVQSDAKSEIRKFAEIHLVVDESISMGIGATKQEQQKLYSAINCAIACHTPPDATSAHLRTSGSLVEARASGAILRIDVVRSALEGSLKQLPEYEGDVVKFALHTFTAKLETQVPLTSDMETLLDGVADLEIDGDWGKGGTAYRPTFNQLEDIVGTSGKGESPSDPKKIVVFVTDGVETNLQHYDDGLGGKRTVIEGWKNFAPTLMFNQNPLTAQQGLDPRICNDFKDATKAELIVLSVEYLIPANTSGSQRFPWTENNLLPLMESRAQQCATSPDLAFHAETPEEIEAEIKKIVLEIVDLERTRLTH